MIVGKFFKTYGRDPERTLDGVIPASLHEERDYGRIDQLYWDNIKDPYQPVYGVDIPHSLMDHPDSCPYKVVLFIPFIHFFHFFSEGAKDNF